MLTIKSFVLPHVLPCVDASCRITRSRVQMCVQLTHTGQMEIHVHDESPACGPLADRAGRKAIVLSGVRRNAHLN